MTTKNVSGRRTGAALIVEGGEAGVVYLLDFALALLYFGLLPGLTGWTIGKLMTGIRVVRADRRRAGVGRNLVRLPAAAAAAPAANWYPDPSGAPVMRWWDGHDWTPHTR